MNTVALPIEQQVNGVQGMLYMQSTSASDGTYSLIVTFEIGTDLNFAQVLVQNRVSAAMASLPQAVQVQGVTVQQKSTSILQIVTLTSPDGRYDSLFLSNYATISLVPELSRVPGVGNVNVFGVGQYSMRIWLDPQTLQARGLAPAGRDQGDPAAEPAGHRRPGRRAAGAGGTGLPVHGQRRGSAHRSGRIRQHHRQDRQRQRRPDHPGEGRRAGRAGRADLLAVVQAERQAGGGHRHLPVADRQRAERGDAASMPGWPSWPSPSRRA